MKINIVPLLINSKISIFLINNVCYIENEHFVKSHKLCHTWFSLNSQYSILILHTIQFGAQVGRLTVAKGHASIFVFHLISIFS